MGTATFKIVLKYIYLVVFAAYLTMCAYWTATGFKYGLLRCINFLVSAAEIYAVVFGIIFAFYCIYKIRLIGKIEDRLFVYGYDEEYFRLLKRYLFGLNKNDAAMLYASSCAEANRFADCLKFIKKTTFADLNKREKTEYFNILLYSALSSDNMPMANAVYKKGWGYLQLAAKKKNSGNILHTLGLYFLKQGDMPRARACFIKASSSNAPHVVCECDLILGEIYLKEGNKEAAKQCAIDACENVCVKDQSVRLKKLMIKVQQAYGLT